MEKTKFRAAVIAAIAISAAAAMPALGQETPYPDRETARPIIINPKMFEFELTVESLATNQALDESGEPVDTEDVYSILHAEVLLRYGVLPRWEIMLTIPYITGEIGETSGGSIGDVRGGTRIDLILTESIEVSLDLEASFPSGDSDYHYEKLEDGLNIQNFRTGDPYYNFYPGFSARYRSDLWSVRFSGAYAFTGEDEVRFNRVNGYDDTRTVNPGDGYRMKMVALYQLLDKLALGAGLDYYNFGETVAEDLELDDQRQLLELEPRLVYQLEKEVDLVFAVGVPLYGENVPLAYPVIIGVRSRF